MTLEDVLRAPLPTRIGRSRSGCEGSRKRCRRGTACGRSRSSTRGDGGGGRARASRHVRRPALHALARRRLREPLLPRPSRACAGPEKRPPRAWTALFEARAREGFAPIQFALAGMNAHINRDLPLALVKTCRARDVVPARGSPQHADFRAIDPLLAETEARVRRDFATGLSAGRTRRSASSTAPSRCGRSAGRAPAAGSSARRHLAHRRLNRTRPRGTCPGTVPGHVPSGRVQG